MHVRPWTTLASFVCLATALFASTSAFAQATQPAASPAPPAQQQAAPAPQTQPVPAARVPVFNRANEHLPSWLRVRGEFRERIEGFESGGFVDDRDDYYALSRFRFNVAVTAKPWLSFQTNLHDARVGDKEVGPVAPPFRAPFDIRTAFADVGTGKSPVALRLGRQELAFGEQRLLGHLAWVNTGRVWDAARATLRSKPVQVDVFAASLVRFLPNDWDRSGFGNRLYGAYASAGALIPQAVVEPYAIFRRDENLASELGPRGTLQQTTAGVRVAGKLPARLDYGVEMAAQRGSLAQDDVSAWAGHWQIRESLPGKGAVKLVSEYNFASGDGNSTDGVRHTFDQLYPTGHDKLGLSDQVGWRNIHHLREGVEFSPWKNTPVSVSYHTWWLANRSDGLYAASGAPLARVPGGAASSHVGQEIDVQVTRALTPQLALTGGYAFLAPGKFLDQATPGASYSAPFVMATYTFLAEK
jgi:hypothetical protein